VIRFMIKLLCSFGTHAWRTIMDANIRECRDCGIQQRLEFYSNRTQKWIDINVR